MNKPLCWGYPIYYVYATVVGDTGTETTMYINNLFNGDSYNCPILYGYVDIIKYDCESNDNINYSYHEITPTVIEADGPYYIADSSTTRMFMNLMYIAPNDLDYSLAFLNNKFSSCSYFNASGSVDIRIAQDPYVLP